MASAPLDDDASSSNDLHIVARVGAARWTVLLAAPAVAALGTAHPDLAGAGLSDTALHRVMEGLRIKAVGLGCYGGGTLSLDAGELAEAPIGEADGEESVALPRWYDIVDIGEVGRRDFRLIA
jgi:hypothetical protein